MGVVIHMGWLMVLVVMVRLGDSQSSDDEESGMVLTVQSTSPFRSVHLRHIGLNPKQNDSIPGLRFSVPEIHFLSVEVDHRSKELFLYDVHFKTVFLGVNYNAPMKLGDSNMSFSMMHVGVSTGAVQLAYDWLSRTLYWVDSVFKWIVATPGSAEKVARDHFKIVIQGNIEHPEGLTVDPIAGYMFFSDNGVVPKIERALLDGSQRTVLADIKGLISPQCLEVDIAEKRLYIVDTTGEKIISVNYDGKDQQVVRRLSFTIMTDIAIYRDTLYVTNVRTGSLYLLNKTTGAFLIGPISIPSETIYGLAVYKEDAQPLKPNAETNCTTLDCDHICVSTKNGAKCICSEGFERNASTNTCEEAAGKFHRALVLASPTHICLADVRSLSSHATNYVLNCVYSVFPTPVTAVPTTTPTTTSKTTTIAATPSSSLMTTPKMTPTTSPTKVSSTTVASTIITHDMHMSSSSTTVKTTIPTSTRSITNQPPSFPTAATSSTSAPTGSGGRRKKRQAITSSSTVAPTQASTSASSSTVTRQMAPEKTIVQFDLDMVKRMVYFALNDSSIHERPIDLAIEDDQTVQLVVAAGKVSGLAFDWVDEDNLYWCESDTGSINVVNVQTSSVKQVITSLKSPSNLRVLGHERKLLWVAKEGEEAYTINSADLDGGNKKEIVNGRQMITSVTINQDARLIYWTEAGSIYSTEFEGTKPNTSFVSKDTPELLVVYKNYLVWTEPVDEGGIKFESFIVDINQTGNAWQYDDTTLFADMKVLDALEQPPEPDNKCAFRNGNCEQLCITHIVNDTVKKECECTFGFTLQPDGLTCGTEYVEDDFVLVTDWTNDRIFQVDMKTNNVSALHFEEQTTYFGTFYNKLTRKVVWSELNSAIIYTSNLNGSNKMELFDHGVGQVEKFALDETTGNLFYTINDYPWTAEIGVLSPRGEQKYLELDRNFTMSYFFNGIDVHPVKGMLYFVASSYFYSSSIVKANMDGSNVQLLQIAAQQAFSLPEGIAVDHVHNKLYWSDYYQDKIYQCDLDGSNCFNFTGNPSADIKDIATDGEFLYYTAWNKHHVTRVELSNPKHETFVGRNFEFGRLETISVYRSTKHNDQKPNTYCQLRNGLGPCSVFCLPTMTGYTCACDELDELASDNRTCPGEFLCDTEFNQTNSNDITIRVDDKCLLFVGEVCNFQCPKNYKSIAGNNGTLTCTPGGWDKQLTTLCEAVFCPMDLTNGQWSDCDRMAGKSCDYTCNPGFRKIGKKPTCQESGQWDLNTATLCSSKICITPLKNAAIDSSCTLSNGTTCGFTCNDGYKLTNSSVTSLTCNLDGTWNRDADSLCEETLCPSTIVNGKISSGCNLAVGAVCTFTCAAGYTKPAGLSNLKCLPDHTWDSKGQTPCAAICTKDQFKCDSTTDCIDNAKLCDGKADCADRSDESPKTCLCPKIDPPASFRSTCSYRVNATCTFTCDSGYSKTVDTLTCQQATRTWSPANPCIETVCPPTVANGNVNKETCDLKVNTRCNFSCGTAFDKNPDVHMIICQNSGSWNQTTGLCLSRISVVSPKKSNKGAATAGTVVGVIVGLIVMGVVVVALVVFRRRLGFFKKESPYSTASFSSSSRESVAIENPGYMSTSLQVANDMDEPYIDTAMREPTYSGVTQPSVDHNDVDTGIANPLYFNQEPLAGNTEMDGTESDQAVLTMDSWLKEQAKGPDDASNNNQ